MKRHRWDVQNLNVIRLCLDCGARIARRDGDSRQPWTYHAPRDRFVRVERIPPCEPPETEEP